MVRITEDLLRKRAEHNDGILSNLKEITLHQYEIEKIELVGTLCKELEILFLQNNKIAKIENLHKLKNLKYLNLAINQVQQIENLEACEALEKLDLTMNSIRLLTSITSLKNNLALKEMFLLGNPCAKYDGYRFFVITTLPQLERLDGIEISKSERIQARQEIDNICKMVLQQEIQTLENTPKTTQEAVSKIDKIQTEETPKPAPMEQKSGRVLQKNEGNWDFTLQEDDTTVTLDVKLSRFLDTSLIEVSVQPKYISVTIKGKLLRLSFPCEVKTNAKAERSTTTGGLKIALEKLCPTAVLTVNPSLLQVFPKSNKTIEQAEAVNIRNIVHPSLETTPKEQSDVPDLEEM